MSQAESAELFQHPDRNLAMELVRATEAAAIRATPWIGRGDKNVYCFVRAKFMDIKNTN